MMPGYKKDDIIYALWYNVFRDQFQSNPSSYFIMNSTMTTLHPYREMLYFAAHRQTDSAKLFCFFYLRSLIVSDFTFLSSKCHNGLPCLYLQDNLLIPSQ